MIFKKVLALFLLLSFLFMVTSCKDEEKNMILSNGYSADNNKELSKIKSEYDLQQLYDFFGEHSLNEALGFNSLDYSSLTITKVDKVFPIEILRKNNNCFYSVYKVKKGGYFYIFWASTIPDSFSSAEEKREPIVYFTAYLSKLLSSSKFDMLKIGIDTAEEVHKIDPSFELCFLLSNGTYSYSLLEDYTVMEIKYDHAKTEDLSSLVIKEMNVLSKDKVPSNLSHILINDLP